MPRNNDDALSSTSNNAEAQFEKIRDYLRHKADLLYPDASSSVIINNSDLKKISGSS